MPLRCLTALLLLVCSATASAASIDSGEAAYERCALCHGLYGNTIRTKFPKLANQNPVYLEQQIRDFLDGRRANDGGQMATVVTEIKESDIPDIIAWFASQDAPTPTGDPEPKGEELFVGSGCLECHAEAPLMNNGVPFLSAQHAAYLAKQMRDFRDGARSTEMLKGKLDQLQRWSDLDIDAVAQHLASSARPQ